MDLKEFDALLHDAEVKLKRLKALYEQWFQGIERTEPQVARKDLERTFALLNKEKPRNTAARFRLQQLLARYSIYTTYWGRIARQIEEGTYERDVRRAQRLRAAVQAERARPKEYELDLEQDIELDDVLREDEVVSVLSALDDAKPAPAPAPRPVLSAFSPFAMKKAKPAQPAASPPSDEQPSTATFKKPAVATFAKPKVTPDSSGTRAAPGPASAPQPLARPAAAAAPAPPPPPAGPPSPAPALARPAAAASPARPTGALAPPIPPTAASALGPRSAVGPVPAPPRPAAGIARPSPAAPAVPRPAAPPPGTKPAGPPIPTPSPRAPDDPQLKQLYERYVEARRRNNERVDNIAYDKLAASVQSMASKLRAKHGDKKIDFEVVVQNGRVGIKPKIG